MSLRESGQRSRVGGARWVDGQHANLVRGECGWCAAEPFPRGECRCRVSRRIGKDHVIPLSCRKVGRHEGHVPRKCATRVAVGKATVESNVRAVCDRGA